MGSSWFIKGIGYLLIAVFLGILLWLIRLKPKEVRKRKKVGRKKVRRKMVRKRKKRK